MASPVLNRSELKKNMKKIHSTRLGKLTRLAIILGVVSLLPTASYFVYAQAAGTTVTVPGIPSQLINQFGRDTRLDNWNSGNMLTLKGSLVTTTAPSPTDGPGTPIMPKFSQGINTPRIVSEGDNSAVQIADDAVVHGFLDVHEGLLNTDTYTPCVGCAGVGQPVYFHDAVSINPSVAGGTALSVTGEITASHLLVSGGQGIDSGRINVTARPGQTSQLSGNVQFVGGTITISSALNTVGIPVTITNNAANATPSRFIGPLDIGPGFDTRIFSNRLTIGPDPYNPQAASSTIVDITGNTTIHGRFSVETGQAGIGINSNAFGWTYGIQQAAGTVSTTNWKSNTGACELLEDVVTMCQIDFPGLANPPNDIQMYATTGRNANGFATCTAKARKTDAAQANFNISARFTCNNSRGERAPNRW